VFNDLAQASVETLQEITGLEVAELHRVVKSLLRCRLLRGPGEEEDLSPQTELSLNPKFSSKKMKLNITVTLQKETKEQTAETYKTIDEDRKLFVQAAIVRIMKARKVLNHVNLVAELLQQIQARFKPPVPLIKACIESLIDKEYMRRVMGETNKYEYLA
jgi:cullin 1